jgi:hypothetical protein
LDVWRQSARWDTDEEGARMEATGGPTAACVPRNRPDPALDGLRLATRAGSPRPEMPATAVHCPVWRDS